MLWGTICNIAIVIENTFLTDTHALELIFKSAKETSHAVAYLIVTVKQAITVQVIITLTERSVLLFCVLSFCSIHWSHLVPIYYDGYTISCSVIGSEHSFRPLVKVSTKCAWTILFSAHILGSVISHCLVKLTNDLLILTDILSFDSPPIAEIFYGILRSSYTRH